jgi:hypothetical protein
MREYRTPETTSQEVDGEVEAPRTSVGAVQAMGNHRLLQLRAQSGAPIQRMPEWIEQRAAEHDANLQQNYLQAQAETITIPSGGEALPNDVRTVAEQHTGVKMDDVRVVHGADDVCKPIQARAFATTEGSTPTVVMSSDANLDTEDGRFTLMHELSHVAQQKQGRTGDLDGLSGDESHREHLEQQADEQGRQMLQGPKHD